MPERYKPREVYQHARKALGPHLRDQGYRRTSKTGPGPSWERDTRSGYLLFGVHAGPYLDQQGGHFEVAFEHEHHILDLRLLSWLSVEQLRTWFDLAREVHERGQGRLPGSDASPELHQDRREYFSQLLVPDDRFLDAFGWPWFQPSDLPPYFDFIVAVQQDVEARLLQELDQEPAAGVGLSGRRLPLGEAGAAAVLAELERRRADFGWGNGAYGSLVERMWVEQDGDDWWFVVHFAQGPRRYEYRVRHLLDSGGIEGSPRDIAVDIMNCVVDELHGPTTAILPDGRFAVPGPEPITRAAGAEE